MPGRSWMQQLHRPVVDMDIVDLSGPEGAGVHRMSAIFSQIIISISFLRGSRRAEDLMLLHREVWGSGQHPLHGRYRLHGLNDWYDILISTPPSQTLQRRQWARTDRHLRVAKNAFLVHSAEVLPSRIAGPLITPSGPSPSYSLLRSDNDKRQNPHGEPGPVPIGRGVSIRRSEPGPTHRWAAPEARG